MATQQERAALEARVYSRAGADDPRVERIDPATGRTLLVTESEWRLLELDRPTGGNASAGAPRGRAAPGGAPRSTRSDAASPAPHPGHRASAPPRRRAAGVAAIAAGLLAVAAIAANAAGPSHGTPDGATPAPTHEPEVTVLVVPAAPPAGGAIAGTADRVRGLGTMAAFHDPDLVPEVRDGWLEAAYPSARSALILDRDGPIAGVAVYAVSKPNGVGCLVARMGTSGMASNCAALRMLASDGLSLQTRVPVGLAADGVLGDGIAAEAADSDLLVAEWHADGTFLVARVPD
ncbi:hypothetical protein [Agromyces kandeliae]|uniref:Uncharacterized protein n=1 Tax=Agromyces kandeliae TaxID=2666141 RepID=A0A6L5QXW1_9MICO|nr:hypothetical protein [Agromyces kandeliae]MRX42666.1 hypothetical protein [Agromyces kandeliae]